MSKALVIVFVKNIELGKVKTRLAKSIGNQAALDVYKELVKVAKNATKNLSADKRVYFSDSIVNNEWKGYKKTIQKGKYLGERMKNAFKDGFEDGYERIVLIGTDLPEMSEKLINQGLKALNKTDTVFGPAQDGGYYLIGLNKMCDFIFENKPWSQSNLLQETLQELTKNRFTFTTLETLNDIDTFEDLMASEFYQSNHKLREKIQYLK
ncbi:TIGR04282 family arsenosugar biosynthesis glycosyltransferase [Flavobacteriaceae bacterium SZ-1-7]|uniref:TIGR04282 family arsenosugar biosynthesis glycosyltransferase n=1 Tax=Tamlana sedimenti TaxID=3134126 RepID=UPI0031264F28